MITEKHEVLCKKKKKEKRDYFKCYKTYFSTFAKWWRLVGLDVDEEGPEIYYELWNIRKLHNSGGTSNCYLALQWNTWLPFIFFGFLLLKHWFSIELFPLCVCGYVLQMRKAFVSCRGKAIIFIFIFTLYCKSFGHCHFLIAADHHALEAISIDFCNLTVFGSNGESNYVFLIFPNVQ